MPLRAGIRRSPSLQRVNLEREGKISSLNDALEDRDKENLFSARVNLEREEEISSLNDALEDRDREISSLQRDRDNEISSLKRTNLKKENELLEMEERLREQENNRIIQQTVEAALNTQIAELALEAHGLLQALNGKTNLIDKLEKQQELLQEQVIAANAENAALRELATDQNEQLEIEAALNTQIAELALEANGLLQALNGKTILIDKLEKQQELLQEQVIAANAENAALRELATDQKEQLVMNEVLDDLKKRNLDNYELTQELKLLLNEAKKDRNILEVENAAKVEELEGKNSSLHEKVLNLEQQKADIQKEKELVGIQLQEIEAALNTQIAEACIRELKLLLNEAKKDRNILEVENAAKVEQLEGEISTLHEQVLNLKQQLADIQKQKDMVEIQLQEIDAVTNLLIVNLEFEISSLHQDLNLRIDVIRKLENDHTRLFEEMAIDKRKVEELNNALEERDNEISSMKKIIQENEEKAKKMEEQLKEEQEERRKGEEEQRHTLEERENEIFFLKKTILEKEKEIQIMEERLEINEVKRGIQKKKIDFLLKEIEEKIAQINRINLEQELGKRTTREARYGVKEVTSI
ncbi:putative leucine-rich repeat-containing protein DDB_G0290503 [Palaemon carinicauda]|uniref:putative leucine-rich repeat-containing protein DDB_G0290503 n=1 Tax=Palaemon carinicauda TaxID=392227 RepID=UPI0035B6A4A4